jgi:hypothetical protein
MSNNTTVGQANAQAILDMLKAQTPSHKQPWSAIAGGTAGPIGQTFPGSTVIGGMTTGSVIASGAAASGYSANYQFSSTGHTVGSTLNNSGLDLRNGADLKIDGVSLKDFMQQVTLRLNMMVPNPEIEKQWDELRTLGEAYRAVEKECLEKAKVWDILKRDNI